MQALLTILAVAVRVEMCNHLNATSVELYISQGRISGEQKHTDDGHVYYAFKGIPYAQPPVGELRFRDPVPLEQWSGVRDGSKSPPKCPQVPFSFNASHEVEGKEDCLYLNVFTPQFETASLPVMVLIHGGAFLAGDMAFFHPMPLITRGVIVVTIHYRLGVLGFLSTEDEVLPGNLGLKDQTLALQWVQNNIMYLGGDPNRVTIFGGNTGAASVHFQMLTPFAKGLFSRAIMQSGSALAPWAMWRKHKEVAESIGYMFNCNISTLPDINSAKNSVRLLQCLQKVSIKHLIPAINKFHVFINLPLIMTPRVDGNYLPEDPALLMMKGKFHQVDIMTGINTHDGAIITQVLYGIPKERLKFLQNFNTLGPKGVMAFQEGDEFPLFLTHLAFQCYVGGIHIREEDEPSITQLLTDRLFAVSNDETWRLAEMGLTNKSVFSYEFKYRGKHSFHHITNFTVKENSEYSTQYTFTFITVYQQN
ncbi:juvenile hormone esterase-like [Homarus americanus]|uniref:juvenile hormone esterase-like n=1 Tax=Homarus americanus TaxID=6706 RepID=UPI001C44E152|nr:juvenile hormone esterase-like [Homarus americanus]